MFWTWFMKCVAHICSFSSFATQVACISDNRSLIEIVQRPQLANKLIQKDILLGSCDRCQPATNKHAQPDWQHMWQSQTCTPLKQQQHLKVNSNSSDFLWTCWRNHAKDWADICTKLLCCESAMQWWLRSGDNLQRSRFVLLQKLNTRQKMAPQCCCAIAHNVAQRGVEPTCLQCLSQFLKTVALSWIFLDVLGLMQLKAVEKSCFGALSNNVKRVTPRQNHAKNVTSQQKWRRSTARSFHFDQVKCSWTVEISLSWKRLSGN